MRDDIIRRLSEEQAHLLEEKLRQLIRDPQPPSDNELVDPALTPELRIKEEKERTKLTNDNKKAREAIFKAVWEQRKLISNPFLFMRMMTKFIFIFRKVHKQAVADGHYLCDGDRRRKGR